MYNVELVGLVHKLLFFIFYEFSARYTLLNVFWEFLNASVCQFIIKIGISLCIILIVNAAQGTIHDSPILNMQNSRQNLK